jgi:aminodeoxyfutalosine deaminase
MTDLSTFIAGLPKVELHVHHVGSASPRIVAELAARHEGRTPVPADPEALVDYFAFRDFAHFLEVYLNVVDLIRDPTDVWILTHEVARELARQQVRYAELTVTPYAHVRRGIPAPAFCEAIEDARRLAEADFGITLCWCFDIPGQAGHVADETLRIALAERPNGLISFGLGGPEAGVPRAQFKSYFDQARAAGLHSVPQAGEVTGPATIWDALRELGAERIGHGTSAVQDPGLVEYLAEREIALEVCLTSNVRTRTVASIEEHPLPAMVDAGLLVTINSDDPPMFGTTLNDEYLVAARLLGYGPAGLAGFARNAVTASFLPESAKARLTAEIDEYLAKTTGWHRWGHATKGGVDIGTEVETGSGIEHPAYRSRRTRDGPSWFRRSRVHASGDLAERA